MSIINKNMTYSEAREMCKDYPHIFIEAILKALQNYTHFRTTVKNGIYQGLIELLDPLPNEYKQDISSIKFVPNTNAFFHAYDTDGSFLNTSYLYRWEPIEIQTYLLNPVTNQDLLIQKWSKSTTKGVVDEN